MIAPQADLEDDVDDGEVVDGPTVLAFVQLARTPRKLSCNVFHLNTLHDV